MRELSDLELAEMADMVRKYLSDNWSIHVALRKAKVPVKYQPYVRHLIKPDLDEYKKRIQARYPSSSGIETSYV